MRDSDSILLIEDERLVVETLKGNFRDNGYHITTADNGEEGLRKFQNDRFDLVITDLKLRGMDGLQVSRKIKKINPHIPVIVVTGYPKLLTSDEASRFGVHDFMLKPFTWAEMLKKVTDCLDTPETATFSLDSKASDSLFVARKKETDSPVSHLERRESKNGKDPYQSLSQFLSGQTRALEMLIRGEPLKEILDALILEMELCSDQMLGSIHFLDSGRAQLDCIAGPNLSAPLLQDIGSVSLGGWVNPWGTAITQNKPILIEDINQSPLWERFHASSKAYGFEASWSFPLRNSDQQAVGVLTFYNRESRSPSSAELKWILSATRLLGTIMEYQNLKNTRSQPENQVESLVEQGREAVVTFNDRGVIDSFNTAAGKLFGYSGKALLGQNIKNLVIGQNASQNHNAFTRIDDGNEGEPGTLKAAAMGLRKDGARLFLDLSVGELAQQTGRKFVATLVDVSKLNYAEKILNETRSKLEGLNEPGMLPASGESDSLQKQLVQSEKWAATGKLAASLAHEFKNPLFGILNVLERAAREFSLKQGSEDLLELAIRECYRAMDLVGKMQDIHRPSSNSVEPMDLHSAIKDMVALTQARLHKQNIKLVMDLDPKLPKVYGIEDQIKQVMLNLMNNAEEAISEDEGKIIVGTRALESSLKIVVKDNGRGIPEGERQKVFEPFFTTKKDSGGMGLGLAVSYGIIKAHGGRIEVEKGIEGKGTSFVITLPKRTSRKAGRRSDKYLTATPSWN
jgi:PAS domain S-box-containing protein